MKTKYENTELNFEQVRKDYLNKFGTLPPLRMMMSMETYYGLLNKAIKRGTPVNEADYEEAQQLTHEYGNKLIY